jgi:sRNA-binding carbon storage regulator CsrA
MAVDAKQEHGNLVLSRDAGSRVYLTCPDGTEIVIEVDRKCSMCIQAPRHVHVLRGEVRERLSA